jgi:hypothetical protein
MSPLGRLCCRDFSPSRRGETARKRRRTTALRRIRRVEVRSPLPEPWAVEDIGGCFVVKDASNDRKSFCEVSADVGCPPLDFSLNATPRRRRR